MRQRYSLFRRKEPAALLVVCSLLLGLYYFSNNWEKLRNTLREFYVRRQIEASLAEGRSTLVRRIQVIKGGQAITSRAFYSPLVTLQGFSVYALECDLRDVDEAGSLDLLLDGKPSLVEKLLVFPSFSTGVDANSHTVFVFVHSDYLDTLQLICENSALLVSSTLDLDLIGGKELFRLEEETGLRYDPSEPGDWVERQYPLPPLSKDKWYEFVFDYRAAGAPRSFFIVGQHPEWFVHRELPVPPDNRGYTSMAMSGQPSRDMDAPVLILRNWGGSGAVFFANVLVREVETRKVSDDLIYRGRISRLGGEPKVITLKAPK
jgi:hypothetical protein